MNTLAKRSAGSMLFIVALCCLASITSCVSMPRPPDITLAAMKKDVAVGIPVDDWIKKYNIYKIEYSDDRGARRLVAIIRNVQIGWWATTNISYTIDYDYDRIIVTCEVREVLTGL